MKREALEDDEEEEFSEYEDRIAVNSESDSEFEEDDEIDHQPAPKKKACQQPATEPDHQQPATGPAPQQAATGPLSAEPEVSV